ncbi:hypothetical protein [Bifidobacterium aquikefiri]|uniref:hypothetical protein n=1 Tax=Bifidobacterium aquikefiri TaxID=1653207 RepID=UPI0039E77F83
MNEIKGVLIGAFATLLACLTVRVYQNTITLSEQNEQLFEEEKKNMISIDLINDHIYGVSDHSQSK